MSDAIIPPSALPWIDPYLLDGGFPRRTCNPESAMLKEKPPGRTAQIVTPSALLRDLLTRCLRALDLAVSDTSELPDLLLFDLAAPDALARCRTLREQHPDLPIVALIHLTADYWQAWEAGANAVVLTPFDVPDLHAHILALLGDADTQQSIRRELW